MYKLAGKKEMGQYLAECIDRRFESRRKFCTAYLEEKEGTVDDASIGRMSNRLSQILQGNKDIRLYDLPIFCHLLELSCEDILSAGTYHVPASERMTNYKAAFSKNESEWKNFVKREDSPILNVDEFGKTFIDYALEAGNYDLLKYLIDNEYIWFVRGDETDFSVSFGAGTRIENKMFPYPRNINVLDSQMKMRDELRTSFIALAIQHKDADMLERLHAREIPSLYQMIFFATVPKDCSQYYNAKLMDTLLRADDEVLDYFSKEFEITDRSGCAHRFVFPFLGELMERLIQNKCAFVEYMLKDAIQHNQYVYDQLASLLAESLDYYTTKLGYDIQSEKIKDEIKEGILKDLDFYDHGSLVKYRGCLIGRGLKSNIIWVNAESADVLINRRIKELNDLYNDIHHMTPKY